MPKLSDLSRLIPSQEEHRASSEEIVKGSDRGVTILMASQVERYLEFAILSQLSNIDDETQENLVKQGGALSTFFAKIHLGYAMGLFSTEIRDDLIKIKNIRNQFAHSAIPLTFTNPIVAHTCNLLQSVPQSLNDPVVILRQGFGREHLDIVGLGQPSPDNPEAEARIRFIFACNALMGRFYNSVISAIEKREKSN